VIATAAAKAAVAAAAARAAKHLAVEKSEIQRPLGVSEEPFHDLSLHLLSIKGKNHSTKVKGIIYYII